MINALVIGIIIFASFCVGLFSGYHKQPKHQGGSLIINTKDPEKDVIRIELDLPISEMLTKKKLIFIVKNEDSQ